MRAVFRLQKIRMARVCSMSLFAVKRCCHRAAECKSVSDVSRPKVLPHDEAFVWQGAAIVQKPLHVPLACCAR